MKIVYTRPEGGVSVFHAAPKEQIEKSLGKMTPGQYRKHVWDRGIPKDAINPVEVNDEDIPDRTFRNAWSVCPVKKIKVDMDKARSLHMDRIRKVRDEALKVLDVETLKGNDVQSEKQALRDIPKTFDLTVAKTPEELKALWPVGLDAG